MGYTSNLKARLKRHNSAEIPATKNRIPLELIYFEACLSKEKAIQREKALKTGFGRKYLKQRI